MRARARTRTLPAVPVSTILGTLGALGTIGMGLFGLLAPARCAAFVGLQAANKTGFAEFRATYGGVFVAVGAFPIFSDAPDAWRMAAAVWFGAAAGRIVSLAADGGYREPKNFAAVAFESAFGALLLAGGR